MRCQACGGELVAGRCPRCARIDAVLPAAEEPPPPVVIPGPPSALSNTLSETRAHDEQLARFAAPPRRIEDLPVARDLEETECPRCAEKIKARAKVCRFCGHEPGAAPAPAAKRVDRVEVVRVEIQTPKRRRERHFEPVRSRARPIPIALWVTAAIVLAFAACGLLAMWFPEQAHRIGILSDDGYAEAVANEILEDEYVELRAHGATRSQLEITEDVRRARVNGLKRMILDRMQYNLRAHVKDADYRAEFRNR